MWTDVRFWNFRNVREERPSKRRTSQVWHGRGLQNVEYSLLNVECSLHRHKSNRYSLQFIQGMLRTICLTAVASHHGGMGGSGPPLMFRPLLRLAQNCWNVYHIGVGCTNCTMDVSCDFLLLTSEENCLDSHFFGDCDATDGPASRTATQ